jgi:hypothetical protein
VSLKLSNSGDTVGGKTEEDLDLTTCVCSECILNTLQHDMLIYHMFQTNMCSTLKTNKRAGVFSSQTLVS